MIQAGSNLQNLPSHIQLHVQSHLVISASSGMQFFPGLTDPLRQNRFHKAVNILVLLRDRKPAFQNIFPDAGQPFHNIVFLFAGKYLLLLQHHRMGNAALYILFKERPVKGDGCVEPVYQFVRRLGKTPSP